MSRYPIKPRWWTKVSIGYTILSVKVGTRGRTRYGPKGAGWLTGRAGHGYWLMSLAGPEVDEQPGPLRVVNKATIPAMCGTPVELRHRVRRLIPGMSGPSGPCANAFQRRSLGSARWEGSGL